LLRASRDTSMPNTIPTLPRPTSATNSLNPVRPAVCAGAAQIGVDHHHLMGRPTQHHRPLTQLVLAGKGFGVMNHLRRRRLAHIHIRISRAV
jgi:hypothetical protein